MALENGELAQVHNIVSTRIQNCPHKDHLEDEIKRVERRVEQMQYEIKQTVDNIYEKIDNNTVVIDKKIDDNAKDTSNKWFTILIVAIGQFITLLTGLVFFFLKTKGV